MLTHERHKYILDKINDGDKQALEILSKHNVRLVLSEVTRRFKLVEYDKKELVVLDYS